MDPLLFRKSCSTCDGEARGRAAESAFDELAAAQRTLADGLSELQVACVCEPEKGVCEAPASQAVRWLPPGMGDEEEVSRLVRLQGGGGRRILCGNGGVFASREAPPVTG